MKDLKLINCSYIEFKEKLNKQLDFSFSNIVRKPELLKKVIRRILDIGEEQKGGYCIPFDLFNPKYDIEDTLIEVLEDFNKFRKTPVFLDALFFDSGLYERILNPAYSYSSAIKNRRDALYKSHLLLFKTDLEYNNKRYNLSEINGTTRLDTIFSLNIKSPLNKNLPEIPENGLYLENLLEDHNNVFYLGWIVDPEVENSGIFNLTGNKQVQLYYPVFFLEKITHHILNVPADFKSVEFIWSLIIEDKIKMLLEQHRIDYAGKNYIEIAQFQNTRNGLLKYGEEIDPNEERTRQILSRIVVVPMNLKNEIPSYELENTSATYVDEVTNIFGSTFYEIKGKQKFQKVHPYLIIQNYYENPTKENREKNKELAKFFFNDTKRYIENEMEPPVYSREQIAYYENVHNLSFLVRTNKQRPSQRDIGVCSIYDGTYMYNRYNLIYSKRSFGDLFSEKTRFAPIHLKRAIKVSNVDLMPNSETSQIKGTYSCSNVELFQQHPVLNKARKMYLSHDNGYYHGPLVFVDEADRIIAHYPLRKTDDVGDSKFDLGSTLKYAQRARTLIATKVIVTEEYTPITLEIENCETKEITTVEIPRNKNFSVASLEELGTHTNAICNGIGAFLPHPFELSDDFLTEDKRSFNFNKIDNLTEEEFEQFRINLGDIDGHSKISPTFAKQRIVPIKRIEVPKESYLWTELGASLISDLKKYGPQEIGDNPYYYYDEDKKVQEVTAKDLRYLALYTRPLCVHCGQYMKLYTQDNVLIGPGHTIEDIYQGTCIYCDANFSEKLAMEEAELLGEEFEYLCLENYINFQDVKEFEKYNVKKYVFKSINETRDHYIITVELHTEIGKARILNTLKALSEIYNQDFIGSFEVPMIIKGQQCIVRGNLDLCLPNLANKSPENAENIGINAFINALSEPIIYEEMRKKYKQISKKEQEFLDKVNELSKDKQLEQIKIFDSSKLQEDFNKKIQETIQPGIVTRKIVTPKGRVITIKQKANILLMPIKVTEIFEEYNKNGFDENFARFSPMHNFFLDHLGELSLSKELYKSKLINDKNNLKLFSNFLNVLNERKLDNIPCINYWKLKFSDYEYSNMVMQVLIDINNMLPEVNVNHIQIKSYSSLDELGRLIEQFPFFNNRKFINGFSYTFKYKERNKIITQTINFPDQAFLRNDQNMVLLSNQEVRLSAGFTSWMKLYLNMVKINKEVKKIFVKEFTKKNNIAKRSRESINEEFQEVLLNNKFLNQKLKRLAKQHKECILKLKVEFEKKKGFLHNIGSLTYNYTGAKQTGSPLVPVGYAVISNKRHRALVKKILKELIIQEGNHKDFDLGLKDLLDKDMIFFEYNPLRHLTKEEKKRYSLKDLMHDQEKILDNFMLLGIADRSPAVMTTQELSGSIRLLSIKQADILFRKKYKKVIDGKEVPISFSEIYPMFTGIMINTIDMVMGFQADTDGDHLRVLIPHTEQLMLEIYKMFKKHEHFNELRKADSQYTVVKDITYKWSMNYLLGEYETNLFNRGFRDKPYNCLKDVQRNTLNLLNHFLHKEDQNSGITEGTLVKNLIGKLTYSNWYIYLIIDYAYKSGKLAELEISYESSIRIHLIFQVVLQLGYIRGLKSAGELNGAGNLDNLAMNANFIVHDPLGLKPGEIVSARKVLTDFIENFAKEHMGNKAHLLVESLFDFYKIMDKWWIDEGGYIPTDSTQHPLGNSFIKDTEEKSDLAKLLSGIQGVLFASSSEIKREQDFYQIFKLAEENSKRQLVQNSSFYEYLKDFFQIIFDSHCEIKRNTNEELIEKKRGGG